MSTIIDTFVAPPCREQITLLYQDEHLLLINKPAGLLSLSGKDPRNLDSVHHRLVQRFPGCTLVHRLDFGTSGLETSLTFCWIAACFWALARRWANRPRKPLLAWRPWPVAVLIGLGVLIRPDLALVSLHGRPEPDIAGRWRQEAGDQAEQRRLARAVRSDDAENFALLDAERNGIDGD